MKASLAASQVDMESYMGSGLLFRRFQRFSLSIPQRSSNDVSLSRFLALCENPSRNNRPFSGGILRPTCPNCEIPANESRAWLPSQRQFARRATPRDHAPPSGSGDNYDICPANCPHRCQHLKVLNHADVISDPSWRTCYFTSPMNSSCDTWTRARLEDYARRPNRIVLRWRLLPTASSSAVAEIPDADVDQFFGLWGYYMEQAPVTITYNLNVPAGIGHHSEGQLVGIALEEETSQEVAAILAHRRDNRSGVIITLSRPPVAVFVRMTPLCGQSHASYIPTSGFIPRRDAQEPPIITLLQGKTLMDQNTRQRREKSRLEPFRLRSQLILSFKVVP